MVITCVGWLITGYRAGIHKCHLNLMLIIVVQGMTALHWAAFHGRAGHVKVLVERKADVLTRDTDGKLPFHWAAQV